jgi:chromosome segregation ATPase
MQYQKQKLERDLQVIQRRIAELTEVEDMHQHNVDTLQNDIERLHNERSELQRFVSRFKNSNRRYLQIKGIAEEVVDRLLEERKPLLNSALIAVVLNRNALLLWLLPLQAMPQSFYSPNVS